MEINTNSTPIPIPKPPVVKAPLVIRVFTLLAFIAVALRLFLLSGFFLLFGFDILFTWLGVPILLSLVNAVLLIVMAIGLRKMKKWAMYVLIVSTLILIIVPFIGYVGPMQVLEELDFDGLLQIAFTIYVIAIRKQFV